MNKQFTVTFELDEETLNVSKLTCFVDGVEKKKTTTRKASTSKKEIVLEDESIITREDNKLVFNNRAVQEIGLAPEDRVIIKYELNKGSDKFPIIGKDVDWNEEGSGNKVTKTFTVTYRGKVNTILSEYGSTFNIIAHGDGLWKLVAKDAPENKNPKTYEELVEDIEKVDFSVLTSDDQDNEIDEMTFKL